MLTAVVVAAAVLVAGVSPAPQVPVQRPTADASDSAAAVPPPPGDASLLVPDPDAAPTPSPPRADPPAAPTPSVPDVAPAPSPPPATAAEPEDPAPTIFIPTADDDPAGDDPDFVEWAPDPEILRRNRETAGARTMVAAGALAGVASLLMLVAAGVEANKPPCDFGLDDCSDAPRKGLATGLAVTGAILAVGGGALLGVGVHRLRRLKASVSADDTTAMVTLGGRF